MSKAKLSDMLNESLNDIATNSKDTARQIVNRRVTPSPVAPMNEKETKQAAAEVIATNIQKEDKVGRENVDLNVNLKENVKINNETFLKPTAAASVPAVAQQEQPNTTTTPILKVEAPVKFKEIHKNVAYLVRKDIEKEIDQLSKKGGKGFKTRFVNEALLYHLQRYDIKLPENKKM